jgi:thioesterase domain-containing protein
MLVPIQTAGKKPPLFFIHGTNGIMPIGAIFGRVLGPDQPLYVINANGFDGGPRHESVDEMARDYVADIVGAAPTGPLTIGGMCMGTLVTLEVARELLAQGRTLGPVILTDPPRVPFGNTGVIKERRMATASGSGAVNPLEPDVARQLHDYARDVMMTHASIPYNDMPFDVDDLQQLDHAASTGVATIVALSRFVPKPFLGTVELILNANAAPAFFGSDMPWQRMLPNPRIAHVLPWGHLELFRARRFEVARLIKFILAGAWADKPERAASDEYELEGSAA